MIDFDCKCYFFGELKRRAHSKKVVQIVNMVELELKLEI